MISGAEKRSRVILTADTQPQFYANNDIGNMTTTSPSKSGELTIRDVTQDPYYFLGLCPLRLLLPSLDWWFP